MGYFSRNRSRRQQPVTAERGTIASVSSAGG
jgi:hypothetical protein